jgi:hypothetical protein
VICEPAADARDRQVRQRAGAAVERERFLVRHSEFAFLQARGDVGMGARVYVGIDPQADRSGRPGFRRDALEPDELAFRFDVEAEYPRRERPAHLLRRLPDPREDGFSRIAARSEHAGELPARYDVEPASQPREEVEDREAGVGLYRVAHQVIGPGSRQTRRRMRDTIP